MKRANGRCPLARVYASEPRAAGSAAPLTYPAPW